MLEQLQFIENNLEEVSHLSRHTLNLLAVSNKRPAPAKYLEVVRNARSLQEMWVSHVQTERELFPVMQTYDRNFASYLKRIAEENEAIGIRLGSLSATSWPRSAQSGLHSIRPSATQVLNQLLSQVDRERITIMPLLKRWMPGASESVSSVLVAN